ncbi:hypothetical protein AJ80_01636 [Polytolypa hystricis UAMH7299]|uniref:Uncharacterized protein n=1 Tax=Polytolypa hystricis (strain UAMH7299) TaxID=1447883 RepID=A0A2B7YZV3_POLH7|nr:hypothetical protein AJ80_01636 [Polytolypa hystricis UAMH7299]
MLLLLPRELLTLIMEQAVHSIELEKSLRLRLVCKLFSDEVIRALCTTGTFANHVDFNMAVYMNPHLVVRYLRYEALHQKIRNPYISGLWEIVDYLMLHRDDKSDQSKEDVLTSVCMCMAHHWRGEIIEAMRDKLCHENVGRLYADTLREIRLTIAAFTGDMALVEALTQGERPDVGSDWVGPPLFAAVGQGHVEITERLLEKGSSASYIRPLVGTTALGIACRNGDNRMVRLLLHPKYKIHAGNIMQGLKQAAIGNHISIFQMMLKSAQDARIGTNGIDHFLRAALPGACLNGAIEAIQVLQEMGITPYPNPPPAHHTQLTSLQLASYKGHLELVRLLLSTRTDYEFGSIDDDGFAAQLATGGGHLSILKLLLDGTKRMIRGMPSQCPVDLSTYYTEWELLDVAAEHGHDDIVEYLLLEVAPRHRLDTKSVLGRALHFASVHGQQAVLKLLVENGADINYIPDHGDIDMWPFSSTPTKTAAVHRQWHFVHALVELGAPALGPDDYKDIEACRKEWDL